MFLSILIPTYLRSEDLRRTLNSIDSQYQPPDQVVVIFGPNDIESKQICAQRTKIKYEFHYIESTKGSVIHAINLGLNIAKGDIICLIDDDVWLPSYWVQNIRKSYTEYSQLGAYGGQDKIQYEDKPEISNPNLALKVGVFKWNGVLIGNHHLGSVKSPMKVDVLKGVNLSFRREAFKVMKIDVVLEGEGAEPAYEIDICQSIKSNGYDVIYDNKNYLIHFGSPRLNNDIRENLFARTRSSRIFNEVYTRIKYRSFLEVFLFIINLLLVGSRFQPGFIWCFLHLKLYGFNVLTLPFLNLIPIFNALKLGFKLKFNYEK